MSNLTGRNNSGIEIIPPASRPTRAAQAIQLVAAEEESQSQLHIGRLVRRYFWLALLLVTLGGAAGFISVIYSTPLFRSRLLLEVQSPRGKATENVEEDSNLQTQIYMIRSGAFLKRVIERLQVDTLPVSSLQGDIFSRLRARLRPETRNSSQIMNDGIQVAAGSLNVRPVHGTQLIELSCESIHPEVASSFLNNVAGEFIDYNLQIRSIEAQRANQFLQAQVEETRAKLQEAEQRVQNFVKSSGNLFATPETAANTTLRTFQANLADARAERIDKQSRFELLSRATPETAADLLGDQSLRNLQAKLRDLQTQRDQLLQRFTVRHPRVIDLENQIAEQQKVLLAEGQKALEREKLNFETTLRKEKLMAGAHAGAAGQVTSQATQANEYSALRREVEILQQAYGSVLMQASQASISNSLPQNNLRIVDPAAASREPYKPKPFMNISMGCGMGLALCFGIVFLRERMRSTINAPGLARELLNVRELGTIPSIGTAEPQSSKLRIRLSLRSQPIRKLLRRLPERLTNRSNELIGWHQRTYFAENFRHLMTSVMREDSEYGIPQVILVTSPNPGEGKSTISANLGIALAETGRRVLLIDADFRRPRVHEIFGRENEIGLSNLLTREGPTDEAQNLKVCLPTAYGQLHLLLNGPDAHDLVRLLHSSRLAEILATFRANFDTIIIDAPPVLQIADTRALDHLADGVVLVLRSEATDRKSALQAYRCLREDGARILGTVLNDWEPVRKSVDRYYSYMRSEKASSKAVPPSRSLPSRPQPANTASASSEPEPTGVSSAGSRPDLD